MSETKLNISQVFDGQHNQENGVSSYITTLAEEYATRGHTATLIVGSSTIKASHIIEVGKCTPPIPGNGNRVRYPLPVRRSIVQSVLDTVQPDVIHTGVPWTPMMAARFVDQAPDEAAVIATQHSLSFSKTAEAAHKLSGLLTTGARQRVDHVFAASPIVQDYAKKIYGLESTIMPLPVDVQKFQAGKRLPKYDDGRLNVMFMGRLVERKGCGYLLDAVGQLDPHVRDKIRVVVGGEGPLREELEQQKHDLDLDKVVEFAGYIPEAQKPDFLASADITALPATSGESFGVVVIEALAAGSAVIGGNNPGYRTILGKRTPETLVDPKNPASFARVLDRMLQDADWRNEVRDRQQDNIDEYDTAVVCGQMLEVYQDVLQRRNRF